MTVFVSPLVATREIDKSLYVPGLSTTIFGVVGTANKGPVNDLQHISNVQEYLNTFGFPEADDYGMYAGLQYLRRGNQLLFVRVADDDAAKATVDLPGEAAAGSVTSSNTELFTLEDDQPAEVVGTEVEDFVVTAGSNDALTVSVDGGADQSITIPAATYTAADLASTLNGLTTGLNFSDDGSGKLKAESVSEGSSATLEFKSVANSVYADIGYTSIVDTVVSGEDGEDTLVVSVDGGADQTVTLTIGSGLTAAAIAAEIDGGLTGASSEATTSGAVKITSDTLGTSSSIQVQPSSTADTPLGFDNTVHAGTGDGSTTAEAKASSSGTWGNDLSVSIESENDPNDPSLFRLAVFENSLKVEQFRDLSPNAGDDYFVDIVNEQSDFIEMADVGPSTVLKEGIFDLAGGDSGKDNLTAADFIGTSLPKTGLQLLGDPDFVDVNVMAVPAVSEILEVDTVAKDDPGAAVINEMLLLCESRGDAMCIIDPPDDLTDDEVVDWHNGTDWDHQSFNSSYGALYWDWIKVFDPNQEAEVFVPPSGLVASQYAFNDQQGEVWYAPAGLNRGRILQGLSLRHNPDQGSRDFLYGNGNAVNPIVNFPGDGITIWGQRTLQRTPTALDRVNVRRLLLFARKAIATASRALVFEQNDPVTWRTFERLVTPFMQTIEARRGVERFEVKMDENTNPPEVRNRNELRGQIFLTPVKAAEFVVIDFVVTPSGAEFDEIQY